MGISPHSSRSFSSNMTRLASRKTPLIETGKDIAVTARVAGSFRAKDINHRRRKLAVTDSSLMRHYLMSGQFCGELFSGGPGTLVFTTTSYGYWSWACVERFGDTRSGDVAKVARIAAARSADLKGLFNVW